MAEKQNKLQARTLLQIMQKADKVINNYEIDKKCINSNNLNLLNVKGYAQRDLEYMGMLGRTKPKGSKMQGYFLTEKGQAITSKELMEAQRFLVSLGMQNKKRENKLKSMTLKNQEIKYLWTKTIPSYLFILLGLSFLFFSYIQSKKNIRTEGNQVDIITTGDTSTGGNI